jgi:hypothetical protein
MLGREPAPDERYFTPERLNKQPTGQIGYAIGPSPKPPLSERLGMQSLGKGLVQALPSGVLPNQIAKWLTTNTALGVQGRTVTEMQEAARQQGPPQGAAQFITETVGGMAGGVANPETWGAMTAGGIAGKAVADVAHPVIKWVSAVAGPRAGHVLNGFINNASQGSALAAVQEAQDIDPEEWANDPMRAMGRVAIAATIGGTAFGGIGAIHGASKTGTVPEPFKGSPRPQYPTETEFKQDVQAAYGSRAPAPTEGIPAEPPIGPVIPPGPEGPPETPYTPQRGFRGEQPDAVEVGSDILREAIKEVSDSLRLRSAEKISVDEPPVGGPEVRGAQPEVQTVPETPETIALQVQEVADGKRPAMLVPDGTEMPEIGSLAAARTKEGTVVYDPDKLDEATIKATPTGDLLGYGISKKPKPGTEVGAVTVRTKDGTEKRAVVTDEASLPAVTKAAEEVAEPRDKVALEKPGEVIADRVKSPWAMTPEESARLKQDVIAHEKALEDKYDLSGNLRPQAKPTTAETKATLDVEKSARQHRDDIIPQLPSMSVDDTLALDQQLHRDAIAKGRFAKQKEALASDIEAKQQVRDLLSGKIPPTPKAVAEAKSTLAKGRTTHVNNLTRRGTTQTGSKAWQQAWINAYDRSLQAVSELAMPPPPLTGGDVATARMLMRPDVPETQVGGVVLKKGHKLTPEGEAFLKKHAPPARTAKPSAPSQPPATPETGAPTKTSASVAPIAELQELPQTVPPAVAKPPDKASGIPSTQDITPPPKQPPVEPAEQPPGATSARKAWMDVDRDDLGLDQLPEAQQKSWQQSLDEAKPEDAGSIATAVNTTPRALNDTETASLVVRAAGLKKAHAAATDPVERQRIEEDFDSISRALRTSGTELGRGLSAHKLTIDESFDLLTITSLAKRAKGSDLTPEESAKIAALVKQVEEAEAKIKELRAKLPPDSPMPPPPILDKLLHASEAAKASAREYVFGLRDRGKMAIFSDILGVPKTAMTILDVSAPGRQGWFLGVSHPDQWAKAYPEMMKAFASDVHASKVMREIKDDPDFAFAKLAGIDFTEYGKVIGLKREEPFQSRMGDILPGAKASNRAYAIFLNKLRFGVFKDMTKNLSQNGLATMEEAKVIANFINVATGRGVLSGQLASAVQSLNTIFFSPKYLASRFQLLVGQPFIDWRHLKLKGTPRVRRMIYKEYGRTLGGIGLVLGMAAGLGASVETDPRSSDFMKLKIGERRIDIFTGLSQFVVATTRAITGKSKLRGGQITYPGEINRAAVAANFFRYKLAPVPSTLWNILDEGKDAQGRSLTEGGNIHVPFTKAITGKDRALPVWLEDLMVPMSANDIAQGMQADGVPIGAAWGLLSLHGFALQLYDEGADQAAIDYARTVKSKYGPSYVDRLITQSRKDLEPAQRIPWIIQQINKNVNATHVRAGKDDKDLKRVRAAAIDRVLREKSSIMRPKPVAQTTK